MDTNIQDLGALAPIAEHLGAFGTGLVVALILIFRLLKSWIEYRRSKQAADQPDPAEIETLIEMVAENEEEDAKEEAEIIDSVQSLTQEVQQIRDTQIEIRRELLRIQRILIHSENENSDSHSLDP